MELKITIRDGEKSRTIKASGDPGELLTSAVDFLANLSQKVTDAFKVTDDG